MWTNVSRNIGAREAAAREIVLAGRCAKAPKSLIRAGRMAAHVRGPGPRRARPDRGPGDGPRFRHDADARPGHQPEPADHSSPGTRRAVRGADPDHECVYPREIAGPRRDRA